MLCTKCGSKTITVNSRYIVGGRRRRRECRGCGYRFTTVELAAVSTASSVVSRIKRWREKPNPALEELDAILEEESERSGGWRRWTG
jgi:transcriptional regulator NrdR family protein